MIMAPLTIFLSLICLLFGGQALAGSAVWQPSLSQRNNSSARPHGKRYFILDRSKQQKPWDNRLIRHCFDKDDLTQGEKSTLRAYLKDARRLWVGKGLNSNFHLQEVSDDECNDGLDVLKISYTGPDGGIATSVGREKTDRYGSDPLLKFSDRTDVGMLDVVANLAHELGHAWGLYHEHQNPSFWSGVDEASNGEVFGPNAPGGWRCENLKDYISTSAGLVTQDGAGLDRHISIEQLCRSYSLSRRAKFSAYDYLPIAGVAVSHSNGHDSAAVDWESIMMYPSGAGGRVDGGGTTTADNDNRLPILLKPDGQRIPINKAPSALDISGMETLYSNQAGTKLNLLTSMTKFKKVYKASGSGPSGGSGCL